MEYKTKIVGIWGFGRVGRSAAQFLKELGARIVIYDDMADQMVHTGYVGAPTLQAFFDSTDYILPSPGIDTRPYRSVYGGKWLCELDIFSANFSKPVIGITGSLGKTTVTYFLTEILQSHGIEAVSAGNIGTPMLDIIKDQSNLDMAILELSSFQLEYSHSFSPEIAIWTNFHENHLDRHTMDEYFQAKYNLIAHQRLTQNALLPYKLKERIQNLNPKSILSYFIDNCPSASPQNNLYCHDLGTQIMHKHGHNKTISTNTFTATTYLSNWLTIWATCDLMKINLKKIPITPPLEHRLEKVTEINGITFINDSKSTTPASTLAAIEQFSDKRVLLILGGLSKGIDRTELIQKLALKKEIDICCFGDQAQEITQLCKKFEVNSQDYTDLDQAFAAICMPSDYEYILFSPGGSSFDLFKNYEERGRKFKQLVLKHKLKIC